MGDTALPDPAVDQLVRNHCDCAVVFCQFHQHSVGSGYIFKILADGEADVLKAFRTIYLIPYLITDPLIHKGLQGK